MYNNFKYVIIYFLYSTNSELIFNSFHSKNDTYVAKLLIVEPIVHQT